MGELLDTTRTFLDERGWPYLLVPEHDGLRFPFQGDDERWECLIGTDEANGRVLVYSVCPFNVPLEQRQAMAELLTRINYGLATGVFEMDFVDGQVRCRTSIETGGAQLSQANVKALVTGNLRTMNTFLPAITAIVGGDVSPLEALSQLDL